MIKQLWKELKLPPLPPSCQRILDEIRRQREAAKEQRMEEKYYMHRNYVRALRRQCDIIDPNGHPYVAIEKEITEEEYYMSQ